MAQLFFKEILREELEEMNAVGLKTKKPQVITHSQRQVGSSNAFRDKRRVALPSGKRISKTGKVYYEYRKNRTDKVGSKL